MYTSLDCANLQIFRCILNSFFGWFCLFDFIFICLWAYYLTNHHELLCQQKGEMSYGTAVFGKARLRQKRQRLIKSPLLGKASCSGAPGFRLDLLDWRSVWRLIWDLSKRWSIPKSLEVCYSEESIRGFFFLWLSSLSFHRLSNVREQELSSLLI